MKRKYNESLPEELTDVARRLERDRPEASAQELDAIKLRAMSRADSRRSRGVPFLRTTWVGTPLVIIAALAIALSAPLALTKLAPPRNAAEAVYLAPAQAPAAEVQTQASPS